MCVWSLRACPGGMWFPQVRVVGEASRGCADGPVGCDGGGAGARTSEPEGPPWLPDVAPPEAPLGGFVGGDDGLPPVGDWRGVLLIGVAVGGAATCVEPLGTDAGDD